MTVDGVLSACALATRLAHGLPTSLHHRPLHHGPRHGRDGLTFRALTFRELTFRELTFRELTFREAPLLKAAEIFRRGGVQRLLRPYGTAAWSGGPEEPPLSLILLSRDTPEVDRARAPRLREPATQRRPFGHAAPSLSACTPSAA